MIRRRVVKNKWYTWPTFAKQALWNWREWRVKFSSRRSWALLYMGAGFNICKTNLKKEEKRNFKNSTVTFFDFSVRSFARLSAKPFFYENLFSKSYVCLLPIYLFALTWLFCTSPCLMTWHGIYCFLAINRNKHRFWLSLTISWWSF